ncbi:MAG: sodium solute transporter superfamily [Daejeonella sp.]|nr:sodium solute transporter superfamily [Daejeonella sp.]
MIFSFLFFTILVAVISWLKTRKERLKTANDYFLGNRSLGFILVGSSLFLTNLSGNLLIGENESVYINNMSVMAWGMTSILAMLIVSEFFIPIYLRMGAVTTPDFLEKRYDTATKKFVSIVFLISYLVNLIPAVLYGGAVAINGIFHFNEVLGLSYELTICLLVAVIGISGSCYSILGGIRAMSISGSLLGFSILAGGLMLSYFGFKYLGHSEFLKGVNTVLTNHTEHLNSIGSSTDQVPFGTIFTGMFLVNLYYWGMEQFIVQQALASRNLAECQKGIALACTGKLISPLLLNVPGLIAVHLYTKLPNTAEVFPRLVGDVLPPLYAGFMASIVLGAIFSTFNAGLNSSSTLFIMNLYKPLQLKTKQNSSEKHLIKISKKFQIIIAAIGICIAPFIMLFKGGFYTYIQMLSGFFSIPIFTVLIVGFVTRKVPAIAAKVGLVFFIVTYALLILVFHPPLHYLHLLAILFVITTVIMLVIGRVFPMKIPYAPSFHSVIDVKPWRYRYFASLLLIILMCLMFVLFSPYGIA